MINLNNKLINELVDDNGSKIGGYDGAISQDDMVSSSNSTTDEFVKSTRQGMSRYLYRGFYGENEECDIDVPELEKEIKSKPNKLKETSKMKMKNVLEDIFATKNIDKDIVDKFKNGEIRKNGIPTLDTIKEKNPILVRKVSHLKDIIEKNGLSGDMKAIILNHLLSLDLTDVDGGYKSELKKKLI